METKVIFLPLIGKLMGIFMLLFAVFIMIGSLIENGTIFYPEDAVFFTLLYFVWGIAGYLGLLIFPLKISNGAIYVLKWFRWTLVDKNDINRVKCWKNSGGISISINRKFPFNKINVPVNFFSPKKANEIVEYINSLLDERPERGKSGS